MLESDQSVFVKFTKDGPIYVLIYIDDLLITSPANKLIVQFKTELAKHFDLTDKGEVERFLGTDIIRRPEGIYLSQEDYVVKTLLKFGLHELNSAHTPMNERMILISNPAEIPASKTDVKRFQEQIGSLIWLMVSTHPNISFPVIKLTRFTTNPGEQHWAALKRVFRYLQGSKDLYIFFVDKRHYLAKGPTAVYDAENRVRDILDPELADPDPVPEYRDLGLIGYSDADWSSPHSKSALSTSGFVFIFDGGPISWTSKKQPCVATSTTESEYIAQALATQKAI